MKVLFLAPQSFYIERGTPIAVRWLLEVFSRRGWQVDVLTFPGGQDIEIAGVRFHRTSSAPRSRPLPPGFTFSKLVHDLRLFAKARRFLRQAQYDYIHAVEESAFLAAMLRNRARIGFVYDMDSSIPDQLAAKRLFWKLLHPATSQIESWMIRRAAAVLAVCPALAQKAARFAQGPVLVLPDPPVSGPVPRKADEKVLAEIGDRRPAIVYTGNLERYQGIELLLKSFRLALTEGARGYLFLVGGQPSQIEKLRRVSCRCGLSEFVFFLGQRPLGEIAHFLAAADILVSPRQEGVNTPMKIYSYLQAGKPILATAIPSHTQVLTSEAALLAAPKPRPLAEALVRILSDESLRERLANGARALAREYTIEAYQRNASKFCELMEDLARRATMGPNA